MVRHTHYQNKSGKRDHLRSSHQRIRQRTQCHIQIVDPLTQRELSCLHHAALDKSCRQTAEFLRISPETVKKHRKAVLQKLGCQTMTGALMIAFQQALLQL